MKVKGISVRYLKSRKTWCVFCEFNKERWNQSFPDKRTADRVAEEYGKRHLRGEDIRPARFQKPIPDANAPKPGTIRAEAYRWLIESQQARRGGTNDCYETHLRTHILPVLGDLHVNEKEFTRKVCMDFARSLVGKVSERTGRPLGGEIRRGIVRTLGNFGGWARNQHPVALPYNPADDLKQFVFDADERAADMVVWTHEEVERVIAAARKYHPHWRAMIEFAIKTGLRGGELVELRWDDDFRIPGYVLVQRQYLSRPRRTYHVGADGMVSRDVNTSAPRVVPPKGKKARRVPYRPDVERLLEAHRAEQRKEAFKSGRRPSDLVFTSPLGHRVNIGNMERRVMADLCHRAQVPVTTGFHTTRHTYATVLLYAGVPLATVSEWLGHADEATTERHYKHFIRDARRDAAIGEVVDEAWRVRK